MGPSVVLITGVSRFLGGHLAAQLAADDRIERVLGVDTARPPADLARRMGRAEFVRADIRNPLIAKVISNAGVDTVVHASASASPRQAGGRSTMKELNVIGTMQLLAACQQAPSVSRLVVKSTAAVYGASSRDPVMFTEECEPRKVPSSGYAKDAMEIEAYVRGFGRRRTEVDVTVLRLCNTIGPQIDSALSAYFTLPIVPTPMGYDARLQFLHEEDALAVLEQAVRKPAPGTYNVGGDGALLLSQAVRRAGRVPLPVPAAASSTVARMLRGSGLVDFSYEQAGFLNYGRVVDTTRLRTRFGFTPKWTTAAAFDDFVRGFELVPTIDPNGLAAAERGLLDLVGRLR